jgi:hypothetical protein
MQSPPEPMPDLPLPPDTSPPAAVTNALNELRMACWVWNPGTDDNPIGLRACNAVLGRDDLTTAHYVDLGLGTAIGVNIVLAIMLVHTLGQILVRRWREWRSTQTEPC